MYEIWIGFHNIKYASETVKPKSSPVSTEGAFARGNAYETKTKQMNEITNLVTIHLAKDLVPLSTEDKDGFGAMVKTLDPRDGLPGRKYF